MPPQESGEQLFQLIDNMHAGDEARTFKLARRVLMPGAPQEVVMVKPLRGVIPAGVAGMPVNDAVRRFKLIGGMCEAGDHHDLGARSPGQPGQTGTEADKRIRMLQPAGALGQRARSDSGRLPVSSSAPWGM